MPPIPSNNQVDLFQSLFRGREDVFANRWEKGKKSGYMPAYRYDPYLYRIHKIKGGTFQNYPDKTYKKLTNEENCSQIKLRTKIKEGIKRRLIIKVEAT